jgi:hypothetical protein
MTDTQPRASNILIPTEGDVISANEWGAPIATQVNTNTTQIATNTSGIASNTSNLAAKDGSWVGFTPAINTGTPGAGTVQGRYKLVGAKTMELQFSWAWGTGAAGGSGVYLWTLPTGNWASQILDYQVVGVAHVVTGGGGVRNICTVHKVAPNKLAIFGTWGQLSASVPAPVQINDGYYVDATCELA